MKRKIHRVAGRVSFGDEAGNMERNRREADMYEPVRPEFRSFGERTVERLLVVYDAKAAGFFVRPLGG